MWQCLAADGEFLRQFREVFRIPIRSELTIETSTFCFKPCIAFERVLVHYEWKKISRWVIKLLWLEDIEYEKYKWLWLF